MTREKDKRAGETPVARSVNSKPFARISGGSRPPLRTTKELAEEFGVTWQLLVKALAADPGAPRGKFCHKSRFACNTWFEPSLVRK